MGAPSPLVKVPHPVTGEPVEVESWMAAALSELAALKGGAPMPAPAPAAAPAGAPATPPMPMANAAPPAPAPAMPGAPAAAEPEKKPDAKQPDENEDEVSADKVKDAANALRKLERAAEKCGVDVDKLDGDATAIKRAIVAAKIPSAKVDALDGATLDAFVETALAVPDRPFGLGAPKRKDSAARSKEAPTFTIDSEDAKHVAEALRSQGY